MLNYRELRATCDAVARFIPDQSSADQWGYLIGVTNALAEQVVVRKGLFNAKREIRLVASVLQSPPSYPVRSLASGSEGASLLARYIADLAVVKRNYAVWLRDNVIDPADRIFASGQAAHSDVVDLRRIVSSIHTNLLSFCYVALLADTEEAERYFSKLAIDKLSKHASTRMLMDVADLSWHYSRHGVDLCRQLSLIHTCSYRDLEKQEQL